MQLQGGAPAAQAQTCRAPAFTSLTSPTYDTGRRAGLVAVWPPGAMNDADSVIQYGLAVPLADGMATTITQFIWNRYYLDETVPSERSAFLYSHALTVQHQGRRFTPGSGLEGEYIGAFTSTTERGTLSTSAVK